MNRNLKVLFGFILILGSAAPPVRAQVSSTEQAYLDAIKINPKNVQAHYELAGIYLNSGKYDLAAEEFKRCLDLDRKYPQAEEYYEMSEGFAAFSLKSDYSKAADCFQKTLKVNPKNPNAHLFLAKSYLNLKKYDKAEEAFKDYAAAFPGDPESQANANQGLAKIYMDKGKFPEAAQALQAAADAKPKDVQVNFSVYQNLGVAYFQQKDYAKAIAAWEKALNYGKDANIYKFLGSSYYSQGQFAQAIKNYEKSIKMNPGDHDVYHNLGVAYVDNSLYDEAADAFDQAFKLSKDPEDNLGKIQTIERAVGAHMEKAANFVVNNQFSEAISEYKKVLGYQPENQQAQKSLADAQDKLKEAVEKYYGEGETHLRNGDSVRALDSFNKGLEMDPENAQLRAAVKQVSVNTKQKFQSLLSQGNESYNEQNYARALQKYTEAAKVQPKNKTVKAKIKKVKQMMNGNFDKYFALGKKNYAAGEYKKAIDYLQMAKNVQPGNKEVQALLFQAGVGKRKKVDSLLEDASSLSGGGNKAEAKAKYEKALALDPGNMKAEEALKKMGGQQTAQKADAEKVKQLYYDGVNLYINGKINDAIQKWNEVLKLDPENLNAKANMAKAKAKLDSIKKLEQS